MNKLKVIGVMLLLCGLLISVIRTSGIDPKHEGLLEHYTNVISNNQSLVENQAESKKGIREALEIMISKIHMRYQAIYIEPFIFLAGGISILVGSRDNKSKKVEPAGIVNEEAAPPRD